MKSSSELNKIYASNPSADRSNRRSQLHYSRRIPATNKTDHTSSTVSGDNKKRKNSHSIVDFDLDEGFSATIDNNDEYYNEKLSSLDNTATKNEAPAVSFREIIHDLQFVIDEVDNEDDDDFDFEEEEEVKKFVPFQAPISYYVQRYSDFDIMRELTSRKATFELCQAHRKESSVDKSNDMLVRQAILKDMHEDLTIGNFCKTMLSWKHMDNINDSQMHNLFRVLNTFAPLEYVNWPIRFHNGEYIGPELNRFTESRDPKMQFHKCLNNCCVFVGENVDNWYCNICKRMCVSRL
jgi:hypothetical protein